MQEKIKQIITNNPIVLFMKGTQQFPQCGFSSRAVEILYACGCRDFLAVNVLEDELIREAVKQYADWPTLPQLYVNGKFIGGADIMSEMYKARELQSLLEKV
ncbi:MAG: Grx4 family monothiol glutaredoxin [Neisseriaceae bacterium]